MNFSSAPAPVSKQLRRCERCRAPLICEQTPHTAIPCACGGDMVASPVTVDDLLAERERVRQILRDVIAACDADIATGHVPSAYCPDTRRRECLMLLSIMKDGAP